MTERDFEDARITSPAAHSPLGHFSNDPKLEALVAECVEDVCTMVDSILTATQAYMNGKPVAENSALVFRLPMLDSIRAVFQQRGLPRRQRPNKQYPFSARGKQSSFDLYALGSSAASALFAALHIRVCPYSLPRRLIIASVELHPDMQGRGIWHYVERCLMGFVERRFMAFEIENVINDLFLASMLRDPDNTCLISRTGDVVTWVNARHVRNLLKRAVADVDFNAFMGQSEYLAKYYLAADSVDLHKAGRTLPPDHGDALMSPSVYRSASRENMIQCAVLRAMSSISLNAANLMHLAHFESVPTDDAYTVQESRVFSSPSVTWNQKRGVPDTNGWPLEHAAYFIPHQRSALYADFVIDLHIKTGHAYSEVDYAPCIYAALEDYGFERDGIRAEKSATMTALHPALAALVPENAKLKIQVFVNHVYQLSVTL